MGKLQKRREGLQVLTSTNTNYLAAAAKSLQSCLTLCDPIDGSHQAPPSLGFSRQCPTAPPTAGTPCSS